MEHYWAPRASNDLQRTIGRVQPDAIWAIPHNWSILPLQRVLEKAAQRPDIKAPGWRFHTTIQDYPDIHGNDIRWGRRRALRLSGAQDALYVAANSRDSTSIPMLDDLEKRTGVRGMQMLHQGLERADFAFLEQPASLDSKTTTTKIAYAGTILVKPEFELFIRSLVLARERAPVELHLYGAHSYASMPWFDSRWMIEHGNLPEQALLEALRACDWGFIPMALDDSDFRYNRFSFPTKFITYLAAGLPIITMGHSQSSVVRMAKSYEVGYCSSAGTTEEWAALLTCILTQKDPKARYRSEILRCARENFNAEKMREKLYNCLRGE